MLDDSEILTAGDELFDGTHIDDISVRMIMVRAGVSTSAFYARFPNKRAFVDAMHQRFYEQVRQSTDRLLTPSSFADVGLSDVARAAVETYLRFRRANGAMLPTLRTAEARYPNLRHRRFAFDRRLQARIAACFVAAAPHLDSPTGRDRIRLGLHFVANAARVATDHPIADTTGVALANEGLVAELIRLGESFLGPQEPAKCPHPV